VGIRCGAGHVLGDGQAHCPAVAVRQNGLPRGRPLACRCAATCSPDARNWDNLGMEVFSGSVRSTVLAVRESSFRTGSGRFGMRTTLSAVVPVVPACQVRKVRRAGVPCLPRRLAVCPNEFGVCRKQVGTVPGVSPSIRAGNLRVDWAVVNRLSGILALDLRAMESP